MSKSGRKSPIYCVIRIYDVGILRKTQCRLKKELLANWIHNFSTIRVQLDMASFMIKGQSYPGSVISIRLEISSIGGQSLDFVSPIGPKNNFLCPSVSLSSEGWEYMTTFYMEFDAI